MHLGALTTRLKKIKKDAKDIKSGMDSCCLEHKAP